MLTYDAALRAVYARIRSKPARLDQNRPARARELLACIGSPQQHIPAVIHVTGTKGKGSVAVMLAAALAANGYRVGLYTSPHLHDLRERVQINGQLIPEADFAALVTELYPYFDTIPGLGFPETLLALAMGHFAAQAVDVAVVEVHVGGQYDATNVFERSTAVITTIDYDHTEYLGNTLPEIAAHKAGIIKPGGTVIVAPQTEAVQQVIAAQAARRSAKTVFVGADVPYALMPASQQGQAVRVIRGRHERVFRSPLIGQHQGVNLAVTLATLHHLDGITLDDNVTQVGLDRAQWGGRLEWIAGRPAVLLDIAHNPRAAVVLRETLDALFPDQRRLWVFGCKPRKDAPAMLSALLQPGESVYLTKVDNPPTMATADLAAIAGGLGFPLDVHKVAPPAWALNQAQEAAAADDLVIVTGSLYVVAAARAALLKR